ncbi:hypothetical protein A1D29_04070 [Pasteurellaceae bacterium Orientalotternb1]|nr:hypothetical protein A1D29_04070 [Pasteurellaceae bacterium Orientalotternb1]
MKKIIAILLGLTNVLCSPLMAKTTSTDSVIREFTASSGDAKNGWRVVVKNDVMSLETIRHNEYYPRLKVKRLAYSKGVEFYGKTRFGEVVLNINGKRCRDHNGRMNEFSATLHYRGKVTKGCAVRGAYGYAPT